MGKFDGIKATINANIKTNGKQEITGNVLNHVLNGMVSATETQVVELSNEIKGISPAPMVSVTHAELVGLRNGGKLVPGMQYRITDYVTTTTQENTRSAGHQFDIIVTADNENTLNEVARACLHDGDTYFSQAGANLAAWKIWYCLDNDRERFVWAVADDDVVVKLFYNDTGIDVYGLNKKIVKVDKYTGDTYIEGSKVLYQLWLPNEVSLDLTADGLFYYDGDALHGSYIIQTGKGVIYRMIDEWNNDCPYDFKNIQFKRGVYDGGGIAPDGDEDMNYSLFTFSFRTEINEVVDTSIFGNNGRLRNDEEKISGVYGNVIGQYMSSNDSIENSTKASQKLNDIVFYSHYDYEGDTYYGCHLNRFGNNCHSNSFGNVCYSNRFGDDCYSNRFGDDCNYNSFGNVCFSNCLGIACQHNSFGNACNGNELENIQGVNALNMTNNLVHVILSNQVVASDSNFLSRSFYLGDLADLL